ncbi:hypothetical protein Dda_0605 [Drechslerella dactyloides]|uniref:Alpha/beta hydrolase fold-3 domain-containing protein n=1 Tax=Drechslerella dactyloides TaxID=74499 RepID=A0AAD6NMT4_DREDA|nr:hypothetical protein Dda_0605 [Drechslerella dactyloides]
MPTVFPPPPLMRRIKFLIRLIWMNNFVRVYLFFRRIYRYGYYEHRPTFTLTVPQSKLPSFWSPATVEVYLPPSYSSNSSSSKRYPLVFDIHGGGFNIGHPVLDSQFSRHISNKADCIVVALAYRKTPWVQWPTQVHELTALVAAVLDDPRITHMIDSSKVAIGGFSAGGNLSTVLSIQPALKSRIQTIIPFYPALDFTMTTAAKIATRPPNSPPDVLRHMGDRFSWGYIPLGTVRENPNLSPLFARAEDLPEYAYLVGAEYDMLNADARNFYNKFSAGKKNWVYDEIKTVLHGFTHQSVARMDPAENKRLDEITFALYDRVAEWLTEKVWGTEGGEGQTPTPERGTDDQLGDDIVVL